MLKRLIRRMLGCPGLPGPAPPVDLRVLLASAKRIGANHRVVYMPDNWWCVFEWTGKGFRFVDRVALLATAERIAGEREAAAAETIVVEGAP